MDHFTVHMQKFDCSSIKQGPSRVYHPHPQYYTEEKKKPIIARRRSGSSLGPSFGEAKGAEEKRERDKRLDSRAFGEVGGLGESKGAEDERGQEKREREKRLDSRAFGEVGGLGESKGAEENSEQEKREREKRLDLRVFGEVGVLGTLGDAKGVEAEKRGEKTLDSRAFGEVGVLGVLGDAKGGEAEKREGEKRLHSRAFGEVGVLGVVGDAEGREAEQREREKRLDSRAFGEAKGGEEKREREKRLAFGEVGVLGEAKGVEKRSDSSSFGSSVSSIISNSSRNNRSIISNSVSSSVSSSSSGTPNPHTAACSAASRVSRSCISVVEEGEEEGEIPEEEERRRGRTTAELTRLCELLEEERSKTAGRTGIVRRGGGGEALEEEGVELFEPNCFPSPSPSPSPSLGSTPLRPIEERNLERAELWARRNLTQKKGGVQQAFEGLSTPLPRFCDILPPAHSSALPKEANCLALERKEEGTQQLQRSPSEGLQGLLGELAKIGEPPPYFSPPSEPKEGEEEAVTVPTADCASSPTSIAKYPHQDQQVSSNSSRKEGLAGLVELVRLSGISTSPGLSGTSRVCNSIQEKTQSDDVEVVEKNCILVDEKENNKSLKPWEYELFHGFSQERVCYVEGESPQTPKDCNNYHPRSSTWEEDFLAGFSNLSLQSKRTNGNIGDNHNQFAGEGVLDLSNQNSIGDNSPVEGFTSNNHDTSFPGEGCLNPALLNNHNNVTGFAREEFSNTSQNSNHNIINSPNKDLVGERFPNPTLERNTNVTGEGVDIKVEDSVEKNIDNTRTVEGRDNNKVEGKHISFVGQQGDSQYEEDFSSAAASEESLSLRDLLTSCPGERAAAAAAVEQQEKSFQSLCLSSFHSITDDCLEKRRFLQSFVSRIPPPPASCYARNRIKMAPIDPHSYTDSSHPLTKHVALSLFLDFPTKIISGTATLTLERAHKGEIFLDTRDLTIESAEDSQKKKSLKFFVEKPDEIKGSLLRIVLEEEASVFSVTFKTSQSASALQWLDPSQTAGEKLPYVFTQCQPIHARSIFPCQDTPIARIKYSADVNVPAELSVVMSAAHVGRTRSSDSEDRAIESFVMEQPIPSYLFALAAGDITYEEVGPRTRIYAEPSEVKAAAYEFANTEETVKKAEALFGPYDWERFDLLVMPPSFPYGGMENPRMVFLTPTIIVGDRSGVEVVAHELAHSWTGNLISNATANDFWLNEGFTTYAERRIIEVQDGLERVQLHIGIGWQGLEEEVERFKDRPEMTKLKMHLEGVDPDEIYSKIPYEKGFQFLRRLESQVGRPTFDDFLKKYIANFRFQSIDTETFLVFLKENLPRIEEQVDLQTWIHGTGIPDDAIRPKAGLLERIQSLADGYQSGGKPTAVETETWSAQAWIVYIERLPKKLSAEQIRELEDLYHFSDSPNWEIKIGILTIGANSAYQPFYPQIESSLHHVGRMKYLRPLYQGLLEGSSEGKELALKVFAEAKSKYHPIAQVVIQGLLTTYTSS